MPPVCAVPGSNESECTFALAGEDHTLGNALRYALNKQPDVVFAGYSVPHPSDDLVNVRVQTSGRITATQALRNAVTGADTLASRWPCAFIQPQTLYTRLVAHHRDRRSRPASPHSATSFSASGSGRGAVR